MRSTLLAFGASLVSFCSAQAGHLYSLGVNSGDSLGYIQAFHTGAGTNVAIVVNDYDQGLNGEFTGQYPNAYWTFDNFDGVYSLYMEPTASSTTFPGYGYVGINAGLNTPGFSEGDEDGLLVWNNPDQGNIGSYYGICPTLIPGYESAGIQNQVFWQSNEVGGVDTANCTTAIFSGAFNFTTSTASA